jgi:hypothetical protein
LREGCSGRGEGHGDAGAGEQKISSIETHGCDSLLDSSCLIAIAEMAGDLQFAEWHLQLR